MAREGFVGVRITIRDQNGTQPIGSPWVLEWSDKGVPMTVADLIRERVRIEFEAGGDGRDERPRLVDVLTDREFDRVVEDVLWAFEARTFLLLVGDRQMEGLDDVISLKPDTEVTFLRLIPLKGA